MGSLKQRLLQNDVPRLLAAVLALCICSISRQVDPQTTCWSSAICPFQFQSRNAFRSKHIRPDRGAFQKRHAESTAVRSEEISQSEDETSFLPELLALGATNDPSLAARIEEVFGKLSPEDLSEIHLKATATQGDDKVAAETVGNAIQAAIQSRMASAKEVLTDLIENSDGDVNVRIKRILKAQESPLPLIMVLQLNIAQAQQEGDSQKAQVLIHMNTVVTEEMEKKAPRVRSLINKLVRIDDENIRDNLLRHHLTPVEVGAAPAMDEEDGGSKLMAAPVTPSKLGAGIAEVVSELDRQLKAVLGEEADQRFETLERIRLVAKQARFVIGDIYSEGEMDSFSTDLTPTFGTLMSYKARNLPTASPSEAENA